MTTVAWFILVPWLFGCGLAVWGTVYGCWRLRRPRQARLPEQPAAQLREVTAAACPEWPPVSILKPLKGAEPGLSQCLESFFRLDYPRFELIFAVADAGDAAAAVVRALQAKYPFVTSRLVPFAVPLGGNPKINNLAWPLALAAYDCNLVSDAMIEVAPDYLRELVPWLRGKVRVVSAVVRGEQGHGIGGQLEELHLNTQYARFMLCLHSLGISMVFGPSMLFRRSEAEAFGGLASLDNRIAEDFALGLAVRRSGGRVAISGRPLPYFIGTKSLATFWWRHHRWSVIQKFNSYIGFAFEPLAFSLTSSLLGAAFALSRGWTPWPWALCTLVGWLVLDIAMMWGMRCRFRLRYWLLRELCVPAIWLHAACSRQVVWKGTLLRLQRGGRISAGDETMDV